MQLDATTSAYALPAWRDMAAPSRRPAAERHEDVENALPDMSALRMDDRSIRSALREGHAARPGCMCSKQGSPAWWQLVYGVM